jgi:hypothetical protein
VEGTDEVTLGEAGEGVGAVSVVERGCLNHVAVVGTTLIRKSFRIQPRPAPPPNYQFIHSFTQTNQCGYLSAVRMRWLKAASSSLVVAFSLYCD